METFPNASASGAASSSAEQTKPDYAGGTPAAGVVQAASPAPLEEPALPLQPGPIGVFYQTSSYSTSPSNKGMNAGEKHALAAGFFVMLSLAAAFGIGWWATFPPAPTMASSEQPTSQAKAWVPAEEGVTVSESSGSSGVSTRADEAIVVRDPMDAVTVELPAVNEISVSRPEANQNDLTRATPVQAPTDKSERAGGAASGDIRSEEVRRLKAEAYSETRGDRLGRSAPAKPAKKEGTAKRQPVSLSDSVSPTRKTDLRRALAKCKEEDGLFYQERCKWRLCNGQWGKYGCPSYERDKRDEYPLS